MLFTVPAVAQPSPTDTAQTEVVQTQNPTTKTDTVKKREKNVQQKFAAAGAYIGAGFLAIVFILLLI